MDDDEEEGGIEEEEGGEEGQQAPPGTILISASDEQAINRVSLASFSSGSSVSVNLNPPRPTLPAIKTKKWLPICCSTDLPTVTSRWSPRAATEETAETAAMAEMEATRETTEMRTKITCSIDVA
jgi:hypothetical protein